MSNDLDPQIGPEYQQLVRANFDQQQVMQLIGAELLAVSPGKCEIGLRRREDLTQQHGYIHAGIVTTVLDSACGYAAFSLMPAGSNVLSVEFKVNMLAPASGDFLTVSAVVKKGGRTLTVCTADAFIEGRLCATMLATMFCQNPR
ncbi:MAG: PaaI family thioesterase [Acidobacteriota bacterium]